MGERDWKDDGALNEQTSCRMHGIVLLEFCSVDLTVLAKWLSDTGRC